MTSGYLKLFYFSLLPAAAACLLDVLNRKTPFAKLPEKAKQAVYGLIFGGIAVLGTEFGVPVNGAMMNCRDGAVLVAGLYFGAPAGLIAGLIGGIERWFAVAWGVGSFTRVACSVSTAVAGISSALLRKHMFEDKRPAWTLSLAAGIVIEVFHMTMVFLTNMGEPQQAMAAVAACSAPMITANGFSVMLAGMLLALISGEALTHFRDKKLISQSVQAWLLAVVGVAFIATTAFLFQLQHAIASNQALSLLDLALQEVADDVTDTLDADLETTTRKIAAEAEDTSLYILMDKYDVSEINVIGRDGIIARSTAPRYVGFDMAPGEQSAEFLHLLDGSCGSDIFIQAYGPVSADSSVFRKYAAVRTEEGMIQVGYNAAQFQQGIRSALRDITKNRHVGNTGYVIVADRNYQIVSAPAKFTDGPVLRYLIRSVPPHAEEATSLAVGGEPCLVRVLNFEGYHLMAVFPEKEAYQLRNIALYVNTFLEILVYGALFVLVDIVIRRVVVQQIKKVNGSLAEITQGNLQEKVDVRTNIEFASLSDDINSTVDTLNRYIDEASARIDSELAFAKEIQVSSLPVVNAAMTQRMDFDIAALMDTAKEVGGDFYDFYLMDDDTISFLIADVSGKGIPAAMFMMRAKTELRSLTESGHPLNDVFTQGNAALCEGNDAGMFVTAWQGQVNLRTGDAVFCNAGHNPPLIKKEGIGFTYLKSRAGFVLAGMEGIKYRANTLKLDPGDIVYLYTDGVTEATNGAGELYGEDRLLEKINSCAAEDMNDLCAEIKADVDAFVGDAPQFDDITMVAFRYNGEAKTPSIFFEHAALEDIPVVTEFVEGEMERMNAPMKVVTQINIAVDEIYSNIARYAYPGGAGPATVKIAETFAPHAVQVTFVDEGIPYNPLTKQDPDVTRPAEEREIGGLGIYMVKKMMDDLQYRYVNDLNILIIRKNLD